MARANLNIDQAVIDSFVNAQDSRDVRLIIVKIREESLSLDNVVNKVSTAAEDFDTLLRQYTTLDHACIAIFCLSDELTGGLQWCLITWIPDGCRVRDKMLYSSSREDLKRGLGLGFFRSEYGGNVLSDLTWKLYTESQQRDINPDLLSFAERMVMEEKVLSQAESGLTKSTALGVIPFNVDGAVHGAFDELYQGTVNWVELTLSGEEVNVVKSTSVRVEDDLTKVVTPGIASFIATKLPNSAGATILFFVFCCPEEVPIRAKMMMSSAKATVLGAAKEHNLSIDKLLETRDVNDLDYVVKAELGPAVNESSASVSVAAVSKPTRPGKGRAKVAKFQSDD